MKVFKLTITAHNQDQEKNIEVSFPMKEKELDEIKSRLFAEKADFFTIDKINIGGLSINLGKLKEGLELEKALGTCNTDKKQEQKKKKTLSR